MRTKVIDTTGDNERRLKRAYIALAQVKPYYLPPEDRASFEVAINALDALAKAKGWQ